MVKLPFFIRDLATESRISKATLNAVVYLTDCFAMYADLHLEDEADYYANIIEENWPSLLV